MRKRILSFLIIFVMLCSINVYANRALEPNFTHSSTSSKPHKFTKKTIANKPTTSTKPSDNPVETNIPIFQNGNIGITSPIKRNETATATFVGKPNTLHSIAVYYNSGKSKAKGLEDKKTDGNGNVSWSWKIGGNTAIGEYKVVITSDLEKFETTIIVTE